MKSILLAISFFMVTLSLNAQSIPKLDEKTGYYKAARKAQITENIPIAKDSLKKFVVIPKGELIEGMTKNLNFFDEIKTVGELEREIVSKGLQEKIPSLDSFIGLSNAAKHNRPFYFLYIKLDRKDSKDYAKLILLDPATGKDVFTAEYKLQGSGYLTKYTYSPLYNSFIDYINELK